MASRENDNPLKGDPWCVTENVVKPGALSLGIGTIIGHTNCGGIIVLWEDGALMECLNRKALVRYTTEKPNERLYGV